MKQVIVVINLILLSATLAFARTTADGNTRENMAMKPWSEAAKPETMKDRAINANPITAQDLVRVAATKGEKLKRVELFNQAGKMVQEYDCRNKGNFSFYVSSMPEGLYFLKSYTSAGICTHSISIEH